MRIGTRGSALALIQAHSVAARLPDEAEIVTITTSGDRGAQPADKSRWVSALEDALLRGEIDIAVHSAKDVPTELPDGLELVGFPPRGDPRDALCGAASLSELALGARVGTSSLRRRAQLSSCRPDLQVLELRGNVDTRLRKLAAGEVDALVLALCGLERLGRGAEVGRTLDEFVPAAGQGALALEARGGRLSAGDLELVSDPRTDACVRAERALVRALGASCNTPVGAHARPVGNACETVQSNTTAQVELVGWVGLPDGSAWVSDRVTGAPETIGAEVAARLIAAGADELLERAVRERVA